MEVSGNHRQPDEPGNAILGYTGNRRFHLLEGCRKSCQYNYEESFPPGLLFFPRSRLRSGNRRSTRQTNRTRLCRRFLLEPRTGMGTIRIYHVLPLHQEPRIPATGTPHCRFLFRPAQPAGRPGSLLGHESSRHPRHSPRRLGCRHHGFRPV